MFVTVVNIRALYDALRHGTVVARDIYTVKNAPALYSAADQTNSKELFGSGAMERFVITPGDGTDKGNLIDVLEGPRTKYPGTILGVEFVVTVNGRQIGVLISQSSPYTTPAATLRLVTFEENEDAIVNGGKLTGINCVLRDAHAVEDPLHVADTT